MRPVTLLNSVRLRTDDGIDCNSGLMDTGLNKDSGRCRLSVKARKEDEVRRSASSEIAAASADAVPEVSVIPDLAGRAGAVDDELMALYPDAVCAPASEVGSTTAKPSKPSKDLKISTPPTCNTHIPCLSTA